MKLIPAALAAHLATGTTTLAWCWRITRRDGRRLGFTDHDRDLAFEGTVFESSAGFTASELHESVGMGVDNVALDGALSSEHLTEKDLAAGLYDAAVIEVWRVNWEAIEQRVLMKKGTLGEVSRTTAGFTAEVRGLSAQLQKPTGRLFQYTCDADLGDSRCRVVLDARYVAEGQIARIDGRSSLVVAGLPAAESQWFARGVFDVTSGAAAGFRAEVRSDATLADGTRMIGLWQPIAADLSVGQRVRLTAGCDRLPATCAAKFANIKNFRGFPHIPGNDYVTAIAHPGQTISAEAR